MRRSPLVAVCVALTVLAACGGSSTGKAATSTTTVTTVAAATTSTAAKAATSTTVAGVATSSTSAKPKATTLAEATTLIAADGGFTNDQASCIIAKMVAAVGDTKALALANDQRDIADLANSDRQLVGTSILTCVPKDQYATIIAKTLLTDLADAGITTEQANCVGTNLVASVTAETLFGLGSSDFSFDKITPDDQAKFINVFTTCLPADVLGKLANTVATPAG